MLKLIRHLLKPEEIHKMSEIWAIFFIFIIFVLSVPSQSSIFGDASRSVVEVIANDSRNNTTSHGSGFFIDKAGDVITNLHVINGSNNANITTGDGRTYQVKNILAKDISSDLVCFSVNIPSQLAFPIELNTTLPNVDDEICVIGYPEGLEKYVESSNRGRISSVEPTNEYGEVLRIDVSISPGNSGSPVLNMKLEVIGVATLGLLNGRKANFAVSSKQISKLIGNVSSAQGGKPISKWNLTPDEELFATALDLYRKGEYNQSINYSDRAIELNPQDAKAWSNKASALIYLGKYDEAIQAYDKIIELDPKNTWPWIGKGKIFLVQHNYSDALFCFTKALELNPQYKMQNCEYAEIWNYRGSALRALGNNTEADEAFAKAEELCGS
jgi:S1-C subfamily serine protease